MISVENNITTIVIKRKIVIPPMYIDSNIEKHVEMLIKETIKNECTKEYGYIIHVNRLISIDDNFITPANSDIVMDIQFEVDTIKPCIGKEFKGSICMVFKNGIFIDLYGLLKILVPASSLQDYTFTTGVDKNNASFVSKHRSLKKNDVISIIVSGVKYSNHSFSCFGNLKDY
jgi:DNA-directed RNA polymerase subunit E'/Rpb7